MAADEQIASQPSIAHDSLSQRLAKVLPKGFEFKVYHVSTPPSRIAALYSAPPGERPERTFCESHFLTLSIDIDSKNDEKRQEVLIFALEVLIYFTAFTTTVFVSKADSSGYLHLASLPKGYSLVKEISAAFLSYLVDTRKRVGVRTIVSLFARAQDQYLFPRSIQNQGKHVLDDRGLVKWWCRVLDRLVSLPGDTSQVSRTSWSSIRGYLIVPGLEKFETSSYLPTRQAHSRWSVGHPLYEISRYPSTFPPRTFIPHFPDDPKARFLDELDEEMSRSQAKASGEWKSVKTLDMFWELMAFRQECSAGRMVGFIWVVFTPEISEEAAEPPPASQASVQTDILDDFDDAAQIDQGRGRDSMTPLSSFSTSAETASPTKSRGKPSEGSQTSSPRKKKSPLSGPVTARAPRVKTHNTAYMQLLDRPEETPYYVWPKDSRGQIVIDEKDYKRMHELLLYLDFANVEVARESTQRWVNEVRSGAPGDTSSWGSKITGTRVIETRSESSAQAVTTLNTGLIRKKRKGDEVASIDDQVKSAEPNNGPAVNVLGAGMVRKKPKKA